MRMGRWAPVIARGARVSLVLAPFSRQPQSCRTTRVYYRKPLGFARAGDKPGSLQSVLPESSVPRGDHVGVTVRRPDLRLAQDYRERGSEVVLLVGRGNDVDKAQDCES